MSRRDNRLSGARADRAGKGFEAALAVVHAQYQAQERAIVVKNSTAGRFVRRGGELVFAAKKSLPDYSGALFGSGRAIVFDAKTTSHPAGWKIDERRLHQAEEIERWSLFGALAFLLVECRPREVAYAVFPPPPGGVDVFRFERWRPMIDFHEPADLVVRIPLAGGVVDWLSAFEKRGLLP